MRPAAEVLRRWRADPIVFVRECLRAEPDEWQKDFLNALAGRLPPEERRKRFCLKASKGVGKSAGLAMGGWWFFVTRPHPKIICTSITGDNLRDGLWAEFAKWQQESAFLKSEFTLSAERIIANDHEDTWFVSARTWAKGADASQQANTLAGVHADNLMFIVDEAGGIPNAVMKAATAGLANVSEAEGREALLVIAGNPTHLSGPIFDACGRERHLWWIKEITSDPLDPKRSPRVDINFAQEVIDSEPGGRDSDVVRVNILGQFPKGQANTVNSLNDVMEAAKRTIAERDYRDEVLVMGVDVARFGDDESVICVRQGRVCFRLKTFRELDTMELASQVASVIEKVGPAAVFVDQTGIGAGVVDRLRQLGYHVVGVDGAASPDDPAYLNKRAECWFKGAEWMRTGCLPDDAQLVSQLAAPTHKYNSSTKRQVEAKADLKKRGVPSPDRADAFNLTFAYPVASRGIRAAQQHRAGTQAVAEYDPYQARP